MTAHVRTVVSRRLGKTGRLALKEDVFGIYSNDNPQSRSLLSQVDLIENKPLVRVAQVTVVGIVPGGTSVIPAPSPQRDLDNANTIYQRECDAWIYCVGHLTVDRIYLTYFDQDDCLGDPANHSVNIDEDELFDFGRNLGANIVGYYIWACTLAAGGCAAHPPDRRGFWVGAGQNLPASPLVAFAHELTHVVGDNGHVSSTTLPNNLMTQLANKPVSSSLTAGQIDRILTDPDMEYP